MEGAMQPGQRAPLCDSIGGVCDVATVVDDLIHRPGLHAGAENGRWSAPSPREPFGSS
jgi:hypothetical protein